MNLREQMAAWAAMTDAERTAAARQQGVEAKAAMNGGASAITAESCPYVGALKTAWLDGFNA